jgi:hypothetical protein
MDFISRLQVLFLISISLISFSSCGKDSQNDVTQLTKKSDLLRALQFSRDGQAAPCAPGLQAFENTVYKTVLRPQCAECHDGTGAGPASGPPHSSADPVASYNLIESSGYVDFTQPLDQSTFVFKVQQKHWLKYDKTAAGVSVDQMTAALQAWWDQGENSCPDYATAQTVASVIPKVMFR